MRFNKIVNNSLLFKKKSKLPVSFDTIAGVIDEADFFSNNLSFEKIIIKFIRVIKNPILLFHYIKKNFKNFISINKI